MTTSKEESPTLAIADNVLAEMERVKRLFERSSNDKEDLISYARDVAALRSQAGSEASNGAEYSLCGYCKEWHSKPCGNGCRWQPSSPSAHGAEVVGWRFQRKEGWGDVWQLSTCHPTNYETADDWTVQPLYATPSQPGIELREALEKIAAFERGPEMTHAEYDNCFFEGDRDEMICIARVALTKATEAT